MSVSLQTPNHNHADMKRQLNKHHKMAMLWSLAGTAVILLAILLMNASKHISKETRTERAMNFEVVKLQKPKKVTKTPPKKKKQAKVAPPVPLVDLNSSLAGIEFDLPAFSLGGSGVDDSLIGDTSNVVMTGDTVDVVPKPVQRAPLEYPARAKSKEIEGYVVLSLLINKAGKVEKAKVIEASPQGIFDSSALRSIKRWSFEPAYFNGKPVKAWANQTIRFEMG